jgi:ferritin
MAKLAPELNQTERQAAVERLAVHAAFGLHIVAKWMSEHEDVSEELKQRLATHLMGVDSSLRTLGHSALHDEFDETEKVLQKRLKAV